MKQTNYWEQFMQSGRVEDYLHCCVDSSGAAQEEAVKNAAEGEDLYAGLYCSDRDGLKNGSHRGI